MVMAPWFLACLCLLRRVAAGGEDPPLTDAWPDKCDPSFDAEEIFEHTVSCTAGAYDMCTNYDDREPRDANAGNTGVSVCECAKRCLASEKCEVMSFQQRLDNSRFSQCFLYPSCTKGKYTSHDRWCIVTARCARPLLLTASVLSPDSAWCENFAAVAASRKAGRWGKTAVGQWSPWSVCAA